MWNAGVLCPHSLKAFEHLNNCVGSGPKRSRCLGVGHHVLRVGIQFGACFATTVAFSLWSLCTAEIAIVNSSGTSLNAAFLPATLQNWY